MQQRSLTMFMFIEHEKADSVQKRITPSLAQAMAIKHGLCCALRAVGASG